MGCKTDPKQKNAKENNPAEENTENPSAIDVSMVEGHHTKTGEVSQLERSDIACFSTPTSQTVRRLQAERPQSAHMHRVCGQLLRVIGDNYICSSCGKALQTMGDELTMEYGIRKALSCNDLEKVNKR